MARLAGLQITPKPFTPTVWLFPTRPAAFPGPGATSSPAALRGLETHSFFLGPGEQ